MLPPDIAMVPARGKFCELCTPPVHYLLGCTSCRHQWHEPPSPGVFLCPKCGTEVLVSPLEHAKWERNIVTASGFLRVGGLLRESE
jgi:hypothetical protein